MIFHIELIRMRHLIFIMIKYFTILISSCLSLFAYLDAKAPDGFKSIFNGKDLDGWWGAKTEDPEIWMNLSSDKFQQKWKSSIDDIHKHWAVENGELVNDGKGLYLTTEKNYGNFELMLEYKTLRTLLSLAYDVLLSLESRLCASWLVNSLILRSLLP